jgi:hypothetical protein
MDLSPLSRYDLGAAPAAVSGDRILETPDLVRVRALREREPITDAQVEALSRMFAPHNPDERLHAMGRMTDNFQRSVMPAISSGARLSGQYGGSRQGIAEGLAVDGLTDSMGDLSANMYNNAFNTAQQNMYGTANNISGLALSNAQGNANRDLSAQQSNSNIALQNNAQAMQLAAQRLGNVTQGANLANMGMGMDTNAYQNALAAMQAPQGYNWGNMNNYANIISTGAGMGGTSSATSPMSPANPITGALGGGMAGAAIGSMPGMSAIGGPWGAAIGAGMGLLGSF